MVMGTASLTMYLPTSQFKCYLANIKARSSVLEFQATPWSDMFSTSALTKGFTRDGATGRVFADIEFEIRAGQFVSLVGPSGCGKTTLLTCLAGLDEPDSGSIQFDGEPVLGPGTGVTMVFQDYVNSLFPWKTVLGNVLFGMGGTGLPIREQRERALACLADVGLADCRDHHPWQLSGGMQQRVAIARALAAGAGCLLMDEPFASLDALVRADLEDLLLTLWQRNQTTILFVTHDLDEAIYLSDRILIMGGTPSGILDDVPVPLPRPRHQLDTRGLPEFSALRAHVHDRLTNGKQP
jgi:NitT/TauT family transport system ATP-binding protein